MNIYKLPAGLQHTILIRRGVVRISVTAGLASRLVCSAGMLPGDVKQVTLGLPGAQYGYPSVWNTSGVLGLNVLA